MDANEQTYVSAGRPRRLPAGSVAGGFLAVMASVCALPAAEIHDACLAGQTNRVAELLKGNRKLVNSVDRNGTAPIHIATRRRDVGMIRLLAGRRCKPDLRLPSGDAAIHVAARDGSLPTLQALVACGADPTATNAVGHTAEQIAVARSDAKMAHDLKRARFAWLRKKSNMAAIRASDKHVAPFDKNRDGNVDAGRLSDYLAYQYVQRTNETARMRAWLLQRWDADANGALSRAEAEPILTDLRQLAAMPANSLDRGLRYQSITSNYFDWNRDGAVSEVECAYRRRFVVESRRKNANAENPISLQLHWAAK